MEGYKERAKTLLGELSLDEKMAQINCGYMMTDGSLLGGEEFIKYGIGVVSALECRGHDLSYVINARNELQRKIMEKSPHRIPAVFHMEGLSGLFINGAACFPSGIMRGASFDVELEKEIGKVVGEQAATAGFSHVFAPVLDVTRDPRFGRMYESYGEDETLVTELGVAYIQGLHADGKNNAVEAVAKHFLGFHKSSGGLHGADCSIGQSELREVYAKPFEAAIDLANLRGVMPCYCVINGELTSTSKYLLTDFLRGELGFDGVTVSDYCAIVNANEVNMAAENKCDAGEKALIAGLDVEQQYPYGFGNELKEKFESGEFDVAYLDRAVLRVLEAKFRMGLFDNPYTDAVENVEKIFYKGDDLSLKSALEGAVLLKNDGILPLGKSYKKIAVIGYHAQTVRGMFGGYTNLNMYEGLVGAQTTMAGLEDGVKKRGDKYSGTHVVKEDTFYNKFEEIAKTIEPQSHMLIEELQAAYPDSEIISEKGYDFIGNDDSMFEPALQAIKDSDIAILALSGKCGTGAMCSMGENINSWNINLPEAQEKFIVQASKLGKPLIGVHFDGRPISSDAASRHLNAILEMWNPARFGAKACALILKGDYNPSGKLPVSVAYTAAQIPLYYSHFNGSSYHGNSFSADVAHIDGVREPRYYFGYGLSYTHFDYAKLSISKNKLQSGDIFTVSFDVKNTGVVYGEEVVQIYISDVRASMARPNQSLIGFKRVGLNEKETKRISFLVAANSFAFYDSVDKVWKLEKGEIKILVGASSNDIRLTEQVDIMRTRIIKKSDKVYYASGEIIK